MSEILINLCVYKLLHINELYIIVICITAHTLLLNLDSIVLVQCLHDEYCATVVYLILRH